MTDRPRILVIEHEADDPPALVGLWLEDAGCRVHVVQPWAGDELPRDLAGHDGLLVMGGWMSAHHDQEVHWLTGAKDLVRLAAREAVPTLGICLGHQVAAVALGGQVEKNPLGKQLGLHDVGWLPAAAEDALMSRLATPRRGIHWNSDVVTVLPAGAVALAKAPRGEIQAARFTSTVWGVQWHPEIDEPLFRRWAEEEPGWFDEVGLDAAGELARIDHARAELELAWRPLADAFAELCARG
ncbi:MAG: type 1 glutamine amidotransferase [Nocardioides sp.]